MIILGTELAVQITEKEKRYNTVPLRVTEKGEANLNLKEQHKRIGKRSKAKGSSFERTVAKKFKDYYGEELTRTPQSGGFAKKSSKADEFRGDIVLLDEDKELKLHVEAKCHKQVSLPSWIAQAERDCPKGKLPCVIFHKHGTSKNYVVMQTENFCSIVGSPVRSSVKSISVSTEEWRSIKDFPDYEISNTGKVRSLKRVEEPTVLSNGLGSSGYYNVVLRRDNKSHTVRVHKLVAEAFIPHSEEFNVVNHIDGNKLNNEVTNLEWVSYSDNNQKAYDEGLKGKGEDHYLAKLTDQQALLIRFTVGLFRDSIKELSEKFSVSDTTIFRLRDLADYRNPWGFSPLYSLAKTWSLPAWFTQSESDCPKGKIPCVVFHKHGTSKDYVALSLDDFLTLVPKDRVIVERGNL